MKWCREIVAPLRRRGFLAAFLLALLLAMSGGIFAARGAMPAWVQNIEARAAAEAALFRAMLLPGGEVMARRPPRESRPLLGELIKAQPAAAELYSLRALEDEQQLDFNAAEVDWKGYVEHSPDRIRAELALADFYHRRLRPKDEIAALSVVANTASPASENLTPTAEQSSWLAFERIFQIIQAQALPAEVSSAQYRAWIARYPKEAVLYTRYFEFLVAAKDYDSAAQLIPIYAKAFPDDSVFPVKARATIAYRRGNVAEGLAIYEQAFQPLWPPELVQDYFDLLKQTRSLRKFLDRSRAELNTNPDDLNALARIFFYYQQQQKPDVAAQVIAEYRLRKEARKAPWSPAELYTLGRLLEGIHANPEAVRYYFALYSSNAAPEQSEQALAEISSLLLTAPEESIRLGSGSLSMYRDIATLDQGPGFLNGILSLLLNSKSPGEELSAEEQRAVPYFHRARAAELLTLFDSKFPKSRRRPELHSKLLEAYATYGEGPAVIEGGRQFLSAFPDAPQRTAVSLLMADAFARAEETKEEFAIYDSVLKELAGRAQGVPLGALADGSTPGGEEIESQPTNETEPQGAQENATENEGQEMEQGQESQRISAAQRRSRAFSIAKTQKTAGGPRSPEYARVLDRYLARLSALKQIPAALIVLRRELDRNPDDPGLYEKLAQFLDQNQLGSEQEEIYRRAIQKFPDRSWYHKLARWYLRKKRDAEFENLSSEVLKIFGGAEIESYFQDLTGYTGPQLYLRLNLYAHQRFPHNLTFVRNLLSAYSRAETYDQGAWRELLRQHWFEDDGLRAVFFEDLSIHGVLQSELDSLRNENPDAQQGRWQEVVRENPVAGRWIAEAELWQCHFEQGVPVLGALAVEFPAEFSLGRRASAVYRSLAYFDARNTDAAVRIEQNLLEAEPGNEETLARIGDIYADRAGFRDAAPYWNRIPTVAPGKPDGYLQAATIYWDYFRFDEALRLLGDGRKSLNNPDLYHYEEGAIYESKRDYKRAIEEYLRGALAEEGDSQAQMRLFNLAQRPKLWPLVDAATTAATDAPNPPLGAVRLRTKVLQTVNRKPEAESFLLGVLARSDSIELAEEVESIGQQESLEIVRQHALERQAALTSDPVRRLELRYALVRFYEGKKDLKGAERNIEDLYKNNPKILGVVRATVDFYWRTKKRERAIEVLLDAAKESYPDLKKGFNFEAARKATEAGKYELARNLLGDLLKESPYDTAYLAAMADTYAQSGDDRGLRDFYLAKIEMIRQAPLSAEDRQQRITALRRGLIPALTRLKDYTGAVDQYIEIINRDAEDEALVAEVAIYAGRHGRKDQILSYYTKTIAESPRDFRWSLVLARLEAGLEDYAAAIDAYTKSMAIRPDRTDMRAVRAGLYERLLRFDEAAADYQRLYELAYDDPKWMLKVAEIRARQGDASAVVAALQTALITGRPEQPGNYFDAAKLLESWNLLPQASAFAEKGIGAAGEDLLADSENHNGARLYARIQTRRRKYDEAYTRLAAALASASAPPSSLSAIGKQVEKQGLGAITDKEWRERQQALRREAGRTGMSLCLKDIGAVVAEYFTPEEKVSFASFAAGKRTGMDTHDLAEFLVPAAESAGLAELEVRWRNELMLADADHAGIHASRLIALQQRRLEFHQLAVQLETLARAQSHDIRSTMLLSAADSYRQDGDAANELRLLDELAGSYAASGDTQRRYFELLLAQRPEKLVELSRGDRQGPRDAAANFVIYHADAALAYRAIESRSLGRPPVWKKAYTALAGLYFLDASPQVGSLFRDALDDTTIGERLAKPADRSEKLAGDIWFYYGSRYGEYLGATKQGDPEDFLPAVLERSPGHAENYLITAGYYEEAGDLARAVADYKHALELQPANVDVHNRLAAIYWKQGKRQEALAQWKAALAALQRQSSLTNVPESFWADFSRTLSQIGARQLLPQFRPQVDAMLKAYIGGNGDYRAEPLLHAVFSAGGAQAGGVNWLLEMASAAHSPSLVLAGIVEAKWIPLAQREPIYVRILELERERTSRAQGIELEWAQGSLQQWQVRWIRYLVASKQFPRAQSELDALPKETRDSSAVELVPLELQCVAARGALTSTLDRYRADPEQAPSLEILRTAAKQLRQGGNRPAAREILEFVFSREIEEHTITAANLLGLAEIRLESGDTAKAIELLRRMTLVVGDTYENLDSASALLEKYHHPAEAADFLAAMVKTAPWLAEYRLRLAEAQIAAGRDADLALASLRSIVTSGENTYATRVRAANALAGRGTALVASGGELNLLAGAAQTISPAQANQPFYYAARLRAAGGEKSDAARIATLRTALGDYPFRDAARVPLFRSALAARNYSLAVSIMSPLLETNFLASGTPPARQEESEEGSESTEQAETAVPEENPEEGRAEDEFGVAKLSTAERASLASGVGTAMERLNRFADAARYLRIALQLEPASGGHRADLKRRLTALLVVIKRETENATRQPAIHDELEQRGLVRPRLVARSEPQPSGPAPQERRAP